MIGEIALNMYHAVALGAVLYWLGGVLVSKIQLLSRWCIPAPLAGGLCFALLNLALYASGTGYITFDKTLQTTFQNLFFTTVGFTVSIPALRRGGRSVALVLLLAAVLAPIQNLLGGGVMVLFGQSPLMGIAIGSTALVGGPATAAAYGADLAALGVAGAEAAGLAAATFGLVSGSLLGGPAARRMIERRRLRPSAGESGESAAGTGTFSTSGPRFVKGFMLLLAALGIGAQVSVWLTALTRMTFPSYIGAMLVAVVLRNAMDGWKLDYPDREIGAMGSMFLSIFLAMALAGLQLWELAGLAMPMLTALLLQCVAAVLYASFVVFPVMGRNYDAAVMSAGFIGFAMGATSNAMANMQAITKKYGPSPLAYFTIPMVGGLFIDFVNAALITVNIHLWS